MNIAWDRSGGADRRKHTPATAAFGFLGALCGFAVVSFALRTVGRFYGGVLHERLIDDGSEEV